MLATEAARAGDGLPAPGGIETGIRIAYAMATPAPTFGSVRHAATKPAPARAAAAVHHLAFQPSSGPAPAPRPFRAWPAPEAAYARALYAETGAVRPAEVPVAVVDDDFIEGFESGPRVRWDPAAGGGELALFRLNTPDEDGGSHSVDVDDDAGDRLADLLGVSSKLGENTKLKLRYSNSRKRMKGVSLTFAWDF